MTEFVCFICDQPIEDPDGRHECHDPACSNYTADVTGEWADCECDLPCHPGCCPVCNGDWPDPEDVVAVEQWGAGG